MNVCQYYIVTLLKTCGSRYSTVQYLLYFSYCCIIISIIIRYCIISFLTYLDRLRPQILIVTWGLPVFVLTYDQYLDMMLTVEI